VACAGLRHGDHAWGVTTIFSVVSKNLLDQNPESPWIRILPGFLVAVLIHSLYNHFFLKPVLSAVLMIVVVQPR